MKTQKKIYINLGLVNFNIKPQQPIHKRNKVLNTDFKNLKLLYKGHYQEVKRQSVTERV